MTTWTWRHDAVYTAERVRTARAHAGTTQEQAKAERKERRKKKKKWAKRGNGLGPQKGFQLKERRFDLIRN